MSAELAIPFGRITTGYSSAADFVGKRATEIRFQLQDSYTLGMGGKGVLEELRSTVEGFGMSNWDGYGAEPVSKDAYWVALEFLEALPLGTPAPSVGAEPDGDLTFEWYSSPQRVLSVSVSSQGELHYSALVGSSKVYGTEVFSGEVPRVILDQIRRVQPA